MSLSNAKIVRTFKIAIYVSLWIHNLLVKHTEHALTLKDFSRKILTEYFLLKKGLYNLRVTEAGLFNPINLATLVLR